MSTTTIRNNNLSSLDRELLREAALRGSGGEFYGVINYDTIMQDLVESLPVNVSFQQCKQVTNSGMVMRKVSIRYYVHSEERWVQHNASAVSLPTACCRVLYALLSDKTFTAEYDLD